MPRLTTLAIALTVVLTMVCVGYHGHMRRTVVIIGCLLCVGMAGLFVASRWQTLIFRLRKGGPSGWFAQGGLLLRSDDLCGNRSLPFGVGSPSIHTWNGWNHWNVGADNRVPPANEWVTYPGGRVSPPTTRPRPPVFRGYYLNIPLYVPFLLVAIPMFIAWRKRPRVSHPGHCPCGYDLTGNVSGTCPECGRQAVSVADK